MLHTSKKVTISSLGSVFLFPYSQLECFKVRLKGSTAAISSSTHKTAYMFLHKRTYGWGQRDVALLSLADDCEPIGMCRALS